MSAYLPVTIPTKKFLKKYLQANYGEELIFNMDSDMGYFLSLLMEKRIYPEYDRQQIHRSIDKYDILVTIRLPRKWVEKYRYGFDIDPKKAVFFNKMIFRSFRQELFRYCALMEIHNIEKKHALLDFARYYKLEIDEDITFETLKKMEYRYRQKYFEKLQPYLSPDNTDTSQLLLL